MTKHWIIVAVVLIALSVLLAMSSPDDDSDGGDGSDDGDGYGGDADASDGTGDESVPQTVEQIWANAIQQFEGYFPGSRSYRDNNPGNLEEQGDAGTDGPYANFSTFAAGEAALLGDLSAKIAKYPGQTLLQIMNRYAPSSDKNNPAKYAAYVAQQLTNALGQLVTPDTTMAQLGAMGGEDE